MKEGKAEEERSEERRRPRKREVQRQGASKPTRVRKEEIGDDGLG